MTGQGADIAPAWGYLNRTVHARYTPFKRAFSYRLFQIMFDVDRVSQAAQHLRLLSHNRPGVFSFRDKDHGPRDGGSLRAWSEALWRDHGVRLDGGAIHLLCFPRMLGFVFNPLSVFLGYGPEGDLRGVIYEVRNTFGEAHCYVASTPAEPHTAAKAFHVSPFFDVEGDYLFSLQPPGDAFSLRIENRTDGVLTHLATLAGVRTALTDGRLARVLVTMPFMTLGVVAAIHWQALWTWLKGAKYRRKPAPPLTPASPAIAISPAKVASRRAVNRKS
jgi:uncharacterized protein